MSSISAVDTPTGVPIGFGGSGHEVLKRAHCAYVAESHAVAQLAPGKLELLRLYDAPAMERAVSICFWGRSGSLLLQSYLDGHDDLVIIPKNGSAWAYPFFSQYEYLSVWEKLVAYPTYVELKESANDAFLSGDHAVAPADYYAAIHGLFAAYGDRPASWLNARVRFVQFLHVAHAVAAGRRPGNSRPLIVYAQHFLNDELARQFIADFPDGRFVHTVRDPISSFDSWYDHQIGVQTYQIAHEPHLLGHFSSRYLDPSGQTVRTLLRSDRPHAGMEARSRAIRFEDLHLAPESTMRRLADWLDLPFRPCLLASTFNGTPYINRSGGRAWVGPNPGNTQRRSKNMDGADRLMIFALLYEDFLAWNYDCPRILQHRWMRLCLFAVLLLVPMKMELLNLQLILRRQVLAALRNGRIGFACGAPLYVIMRRAVMMVFLTMQAPARLMGKRPLLKLL